MQSPPMFIWLLSREFSRSLRELYIMGFYFNLIHSPSKLTVMPIGLALHMIVAPLVGFAFSWALTQFLRVLKSNPQWLALPLRLNIGGWPILLLESLGYALSYMIFTYLCPPYLSYGVQCECHFPYLQSCLSCAD